MLSILRRPAGGIIAAVLLVIAGVMLWKINFPPAGVERSVMACTGEVLAEEVGGMIGGTGTVLALARSAPADNAAADAFCKKAQALGLKVVKHVSAAGAPQSTAGSGYVLWSPAAQIEHALAETPRPDCIVNVWGPALGAEMDGRMPPALEKYLAQGGKALLWGYRIAYASTSQGDPYLKWVRDGRMVLVAGKPDSLTSPRSSTDQPARRTIKEVFDSRWVLVTRDNLSAYLKDMAQEPAPPGGAFPQPQKRDQ